MNCPGDDKKWQPIETAPKDGTVILCRHETWSEDIRCRWTDGEWQPERLAYRLGPARHIADPSHWQPANSPPTPTDA